jgi:hydrogenase-4 component B
MTLVVLADSVWAFLVAWEIMSIASFFLVIHEHQEPGVIRAGFVYLVMTHVGTAFLTAAFLVVAGAGDLRFASLAESARQLDPGMRDAVFLLALVGFGTKAGVIPLHVWLPRAHPVAPSHISALMSGVMLKTAVYGLVRLTWDILGIGPGWWGAVLLTAGIVSAVMGVLYALMEHDIKRLLAFHSVENIGIVLIGLGASLALASLGQMSAAALALAAGLFHALNHALFKALLFLAAGAVHQATGTKDMEQMGGLIRQMPWTAGLFLIGAMAISALPPLNGFASEWLTFQSLLALSGAAPSAWVSVGALAIAGLLAMTGALAAACFVKAFGITFLGLPRSREAGVVAEAPSTMLWGMSLLAAACVFCGLQPTLVLRMLGPLASSLAGGPMPAESPLVSVAIVGTAGNLLSPTVLLGCLLAAGGVALLAGRLLGSVITRRGPAWVCGFALEPRMQYGSTAFAKPIRLFFRALVRPERDVIAEPGELPYFPRRVTYEARLQPVFERSLYEPLLRGLLGSAGRLRGIQGGSLRMYLGYIFATLVVLLLVAH